jgi:hypothetical protein
MRVAPLETDDYVLTAVELPDDTGKVLVVGDRIQLEILTASYDEAKDQVLRTAEILDTEDTEARTDASEERMLELFQRFGKPAVIRLSDFETDADLHFLKPEQTWTLTYHRILNHELEHRLKRRGVAVDFHLVRLRDYMDWLAAKRLENNTVNRSRYCAGEV